MEMPTLPVAIILGLPWLRQNVREDGYRYSMHQFWLLDGTVLPIYLERPSPAVSSLLSMVRNSIVGTVPSMDPVDEHHPSTPDIPPVAASTSPRGRIAVYSSRHQEITASNCNYFKGRVLSRDRARLGKLSSIFFEHDSRLFADRQLKFADCTVSLDADGSTVVCFLRPF